MIPIRNDAALPRNAASFCRNAWLYGADLQGFRVATPVHTLKNKAAKSVFRIPVSGARADDFPASTWMEFPEPIVDVIPSPTVQDQYRRVYMFSPDFAPRYTTYNDIVLGKAPLLLGVPTPSDAPTLSVVGGTTTLQETRAYTYTWVTVYGEEGPPAPPVVVTGNSDGTWVLGWSLPTTSQSTDRRLAKVNIYRTVTGDDGVSNYHLVTTLPITTLTYSDMAANASLTGAVILPSTSWAAPPDDLQGCVLMPGGIMAAWRNEVEVWFSEAFRPHAWPPEYSINVPYPIVGFGVSANTLIVVTKGYGTAITGLTPDTMTPSKITAHEPGVSRRSIISSANGIYYASQNGIVLATAAGVTNLTTSVISRQQWAKRNPASFMAAGRDTSLFLIAQGQSAPDNGLIFDPVVPNVSITNIQTDAAVDYLFSDDYTGDVLMLYDGIVYRWDDPTQDVQAPYLWRSAEFRMLYPETMMAAEVIFEIPSWVNIPAPNEATRNTSQTQTFDRTKQYALLRVYGDNKLILVRELQVSSELVLLPVDTKYLMYKVEIEGQVKVSSIKMATSVKELRAT